jgi:hypothetical protein
MSIKGSLSGGELAGGWRGKGEGSRGGEQN